MNEQKFSRRRMENERVVFAARGEGVTTGQATSLEALPAEAPAYSPDPPTRGSLVSKLAAVMAAVERVPKRGHNAFHQYDYATEADIAQTIRAELASRGVMLIPAVESITREPIGEKGQVLTTLTMTFSFTDGQEVIVKSWLGCGMDSGDKGVYKAMTGAEKYFLLKTFLIPTGDDPERETKPGEQRNGQRARTSRPHVMSDGELHEHADRIVDDAVSSEATGEDDREGQDPGASYHITNVVELKKGTNKKAESNDNPTGAWLLAGIETQELGTGVYISTLDPAMTRVALAAKKSGEPALLTFETVLKGKYTNRTLLSIEPDPLPF